MKRQFENLRDGDRFFFSHGRSAGEPRPDNSRSQGLADVAKRNVQARSLGAILCDNLEASVLASKTTGRNVFRTVSPRTNQELDCRKLKLGDGILDLRKIFEEAVNEEIQRVNSDLSSILPPRDNLVRLQDEGSGQHSIQPNGFLYNHAPVVHAAPMAKHVVGYAAPDQPKSSPYSYSYGVRGNLFSQSESSSGRGDVEGSYQVNLPDGRQQTVNYHANDIHGYVADVSYSRSAAYPKRVPVPSHGNAHFRNGNGNAHFAARHPPVTHRALARPGTTAGTAGRHFLRRHKPYIFYG